MISFTEMVERLIKPGEDIVLGMTKQEAHYIHMAMGISGEVAELLEAFINDDKENVFEELGDIEFYFEGLCQGVEKWFPPKDFTLDDVKQDPLPYLLIAAGNIVDTCKKITIYQQHEKLELLKTHMKEFRHWLDQFYALSEISKTNAILGNMDKLSKRYKGFNYSDSAAKARADKELRND